ncbi:5-hydroxytryptamine receptor 4-like [Aplysia californica]|uniref:5-hydroxytryptamine receptor 4-like n=1 Tax=Aplysia californica TaxID=6500 RepID=A0ABM1VQB1_APLCA|nr:5-hydroxytryptamine receptor 4-like [Aplysia californica]
MTGIFLFYNTTYNMSNFQIYKECLARYGLLVFLIVSSVLHLVFLSLDRYFKIVLPYRYGEWFTVKSMALVSAFIWFLSLVFAILPLTGWNTTPWEVPPDLSKPDEEDDVLLCSFFGVLHQDYLKFLVIIFWIPFFFMGIFYAHIFKIAHRHARLIAAQEGGGPGASSKDRHSWKYTKTVVIIMGVYFLCWVPCGIVIIMFLRGHLNEWTLIEQGTLLLYTSSTAYVNSLVNPIIYAFKISSVRRRFLQVFCCKSGSSAGLEPSFYTASQKRKPSGHAAHVRHVPNKSTNVLPEISSA